MTTPDELTASLAGHGVHIRDMTHLALTQGEADWLRDIADTLWADPIDLRATERVMPDIRSIVAAAAALTPDSDELANDVLWRGLKAAGYTDFLLHVSTLSPAGNVGNLVHGLVHGATIEEAVDTAIRWVSGIRDDEEDERAISLAERIHDGETRRRWRSTVIGRLDHIGANRAVWTGAFIDVVPPAMGAVPAAALFLTSDGRRFGKPVAAWVAEPVDLTEAVVESNDRASTVLDVLAERNGGTLLVETSTGNRWVHHQSVSN